MALLLLNEEERYAKAEALHTRSETTSPPKLQIICYDYCFGIAKNAKNLAYAKEIVYKWNTSEENAFDQLPDILRNSMLYYLLSEAREKDRNKQQLVDKNFYELSFMLMNQTTVKLDYGVYKLKTLYRRNTAASFTTTLQEFQEILAYAAVECPNLEHLVVHGLEKDSNEPIFKRAKDSMALRSGVIGIHHLLQLEQLRHLDIYGIWYWTDEGLNKLFSHLKKLITLKLLIHSNASVSGFQNIHLLKELEEFHFVVGNPEVRPNPNSKRFARHYELIYTYCAQNVPSLKLIGAPTSDCADDHSLTYDCNLKHVIPKIEGNSKLEHLHTNRTLPEAEFPNLRNLHFHGPISSDAKFFQKFGTFTHLTTLNLGHLTSEGIDKMLELVGKNLNTLTIDYGQTGDLFKILHLCPNLVRFLQIECRNDREGFDEVNRGGDQTSEYEALVTEHNVRLLERCEVNFDGLHGGKDRLFELLVFAPLLKNLKLMFISMTKTQCQLFHDVAEGKLSNLGSILIHDLDLDPSCSMDDFGLMVQCLACSAPRLDYLNFYWSAEDDDVYLNGEWDLGQNVAQSFQELVMKN